LPHKTMQCILENSLSPRRGKLLGYIHKIRRNF
jgi:hypothetical protein